MDPITSLRTKLAGQRPLIMGVLNVTPDSFSDGGRFHSRAAARERARAMVDEGADIIDVGGESTRPGAQGVGVDEEHDRVIPLLEDLQALGHPLSIDTSKPEIMAAAAGAGAAMINDVRALRAEGAIEIVARLELPVCLVHMQGEPRTMQTNPHYDDVVREVGDYLAERVSACERAGIARDRLILDPGFGFGKDLDHNLALLARMGELVARLQCPLLAGISRKRMIGTLTGDAPADQRLHGSVAAAVVAVLKGASIVRVHDVAATRQALAVAAAVRQTEVAA